MVWFASIDLGSGTQFHVTSGNDDNIFVECLQTHFPEKNKKASADFVG